MPTSLLYIVTIMKKLFFYLLLLAATTLVSCHQKVLMYIELNNSSDDFRQNEMICIPLDSIRAHTSVDISNIIVKDEEGEEVPYQVISYPTEAIIFPATPKSNITTVYTLCKGTPKAVTPLVSARFVPERKDDFAWENNLAAYRMYGPALAPENPSNGVDLWLKCTDELVVDTFYYREHNLGKPYHVNYGKGLDCYKVGHQPGCGGWFPMIKGIPQIGTQYERWEILSEGPLQVSFRLYYDAYPLASLDSAKASAMLTITCSAWQPVCKAEVCFVAPEDVDSTLLFGAGIFLHNATACDTIPVGGNTQICAKTGSIAYAENAVADAGDPQGRNYAAVILPGMREALPIDGSLVATGEFTLTPGTNLLNATYYFGGGWSEWHYLTDQDWFEAISLAARTIAEPTTWTIR